MNVLGLACFFTDEHKDFFEGVPQWFFHDSAAALVRDGQIICASEEERLNRIKHTNKFANRAAQWCLAEARLTLAEIDHVAFHVEEQFANRELDIQMLEHVEIPLQNSRERLVKMLGATFKSEIDPQKIHFVRHHLAHAFTVYHHSGFDEALVPVIDGQGENDAVSIYVGSSGTLHLLKRYDESQSLGHLYSYTTEFFGFGLFDEYKVMGLAPYGDRTVYKPLFDAIVQLQPDGEYQLDLPNLKQRILEAGIRPRRRAEAFSATHQHLAAALQDTLETIAWHIILFWADHTEQRRLCLSGGVAQNCAMNGSLLRRSRFDEIFVHPASHDAGSAVGAAMAVCHKYSPRTFAPGRLQHVFLGRPLAPSDAVWEILNRWSTCIDVVQSGDVCRHGAELLADSKIIGWVQGRAEFGPRALGNRSILADPRPVANKDRVNAAVKKREAFRPFAPAVTLERARDFFELPAGIHACPFMNMTVYVRPEHRSLLGAVTHVDGTARLQTVTEPENPRFWRLIEEFGKLTGTPIVLNTSFNNHAEPIVDSVEDALACFLTTALDCLIVDDFVVTKRVFDWTCFLSCIPVIRPTAAMVSVIEHEPSLSHEVCSERRGNYEIRFTYTNGKAYPISVDTFRVLRHADGHTSLGALIDDHLDHRRSDVHSKSIVEELMQLWEWRYIKIDWL